jgi:Helix-turn-helix domain
MRLGRREKVFGPGRQIPLDRNAKARIAAYARAWDRLHRQPGQRGGALGRAALDVLGALLWAFHNARSGCCFPSYERIAERAGCARSTVAEAIKALEFAGVLTWQNRITRIRERCRDLWGREGWRWRVIRTSNAYVFRDPASKSDQRTGTPDQEDSKPLQAPAIDPTSPLERALARFAAAIAAKDGIEQGVAG